MRIFAAIVITLSLPAVAGASDACSDVAIRAAADVTVSDGTSFSIESLYASPDHSSIRHFGDNRDEQVVVHLSLPRPDHDQRFHRAAAASGHLPLRS